MKSISENLYHAEQYKTENELKLRLQERQNLSVFSYRQQILEQIKWNNVILIREATACGKTTQLISIKIFLVIFNTEYWLRFLNISLMMQLNIIKVLIVML
jgi:hypothetical protein